MSMERQETIKCPSCEKESPFTVWQSINTDIDPEMKSAVRDMSAFTFICPHCGSNENFSRAAFERWHCMKVLSQKL